MKISQSLTFSVSNVCLSWWSRVLAFDRLIMCAKNLHTCDDLVMTVVFMGSTTALGFRNQLLFWSGVPRSRPLKL